MVIATLNVLAVISFPYTQSMLLLWLATYIHSTIDPFSVVASTIVLQRALHVTLRHGSSSLSRLGSASPESLMLVNELEDLKLILGGVAARRTIPQQSSEFDAHTTVCG